MTYKVRHAVETDIPFIVQELKKFADVYGTSLNLFANEPYSIEKVKEIISNHVLFVCTKYDAPVGFIAGLINPHFFNPNILTLTEIFWWVAEDFRGSRAGLLLLKEFVEFGKKHADWVSVGTEEHSQLSKEALIKRGFRQKETSYLMENF